MAGLLDGHDLRPVNPDNATLARYRTGVQCTAELQRSMN